MSLHIVKLNYLNNHPEELDHNDQLLVLEENKQTSILVYGESLGLKLLQSEHTIPIDPMGRFLNYIASVDPNSERFKTLHAYAQRGPMFLSGSAHIDARKKIAQFYKKIEDDLTPGLMAFTKDYLLKYKNTNEIEVEELCSVFIHELNKKIIANDLKIDESEIPEFPEHLLMYMPSLHVVDLKEKKLKALVAVIENQIKKQGRDHYDTWSLVSIIVMGLNAISSSLMFGLIKHQRFISAEETIKSASALSILFREVTEDIEIDQIIFKKGTLLYIALHVMNDQSKDDSYAFGKGVHTCPGKKLATNIIDTFFKCWITLGFESKSLKPLSFKRDIVLTALKD